MNTVVNLPQPVGFDDFWKACPKKSGKPLALAKWNAIVNGGLKTRTMDRDAGQYVEIELSATAEDLVEGMRRYRLSLLKTGSNWEFAVEPRYICHPATWLNQGRWMDGL